MAPPSSLITQDTFVFGVDKEDRHVALSAAARVLEPSNQRRLRTLSRFENNGSRYTSAQLVEHTILALTVEFARCASATPGSCVMGLSHDYA